MGLVVAPAVLSRRKLVPNQSSSDLSGRQSQLQALPQAQRGLFKAGLHGREDGQSSRLDQLRESRFPRHFHHTQQRHGPVPGQGRGCRITLGVGGVLTDLLELEVQAWGFLSLPREAARSTARARFPR